MSTQQIIIHAILANIIFSVLRKDKDYVSSAWICYRVFVQNTKQYKVPLPYFGISFKVLSELIVFWWITTWRIHYTVRVTTK